MLPYWQVKPGPALLKFPVVETPYTERFTLATVTVLTPNPPTLTQSTGNPEGGGRCETADDARCSALRRTGIPVKRPHAAEDGQGHQGHDHGESQGGMRPASKIGTQRNHAPTI